MSLIKKLFGAGETVVFSAEREDSTKDHSPIVLTIDGVRLRIQAGDFSKALAGVGEKVKAEVLG